MDEQVACGAHAADHAGPRILLVEDSMIIALDAEDTLMELGAGAVSTRTGVVEALTAIAEAPFDLALLDFNLGTETGEAVAAELVRRGIPFWLATGDSQLELQSAELGARGVLIKPYGKPELSAMLAEFSGPL